MKDKWYIATLKFVWECITDPIRNFSLMEFWNGFVVMGALFLIIIMVIWGVFGIPLIIGALWCDHGWNYAYLLLVALWLFNFGALRKLDEYIGF